MLAVLTYLLAIGLPIVLLYFFRSQAWYWHGLAILAALAVGLAPTPEGWKSAGVDLTQGFVFVLLLVWGVGGLVVFRPHREKHA
jgi:hypothetical protein